MKTLALPLVALLGLATGAASALLVAAEPTVATPPDTQAAATDETTAKVDEELKLPPGFKKLQRGKHTLYCKKETPLGTRFKTEKCFDEAGMRDYILALEQTKGDVDRMRSVCSNVCVCGDPGAC